MNNLKGRNQSIDALKGAAIIAIIGIHLPASYMTDSKGWQLLNIFARFAVPCFFLISGYFFRHSWELSENKIHLILKNAIRIIPIFLFWSFVYAVLPPFVDGGDWMNHFQNILSYPHSFILTGNVYHLWFLSSLLQGLLILWVSLRFDRFYIGLTLSICLYATALCTNTYSMTSLGYPISFDMKNGPFLSTLFIFIGALLAQGKFIIGKSVAFTTAFSGFTLCIIESSFLHVFYGLPFRGVSVMIGTIPLALGIMNIAIAVHHSHKWLAFIGRYSLGIYVIHPWLIEVLQNLKFFDCSNPLILLSLILASSLLITLSFTIVPYLRKMVI